MLAGSSMNYTQRSEYHRHSRFDKKMVKVRMNVSASELARHGSSISGTK